MKSNKDILKDSLPSFAFTLVLLAAIFIFRPPFLLLIKVFVALTILRSWYKYYKLDFPKGFLRLMVLDVVVLLAILLPIYFFYEVFGASGLWSLVAVVLFLAGVILWRGRKSYLEVIKGIERKHFGGTREEKKLRGKTK